ncbi:MAG TPA: hypothetical protein VGM05_29570 [Planctomycetaceae bacterium]|jgi:hypothetical protein
MAENDHPNRESRRFAIRLPRPLCVGLAILFVLAVGAVGLRTRATADEQADEIERLIDALASTNKAPKQRGQDGGLGLDYPPEYDKNAEVVVKHAGDKLIAHGATAFPALFEHLDDRRFSHVDEGANGFATAAVGAACGSIIACQLEIYEKINIYPGAFPSYYRYVVHKDEKPDEWCKSHTEMSLYEMQTEAVEWAISEQKEISHVGKYRGEKVDTKKLAEIIARNERTLERLRETRKPIVAKRAFPTRLK